MKYLIFIIACISIMSGSQTYAKECPATKVKVIETLDWSNVIGSKVIETGITGAASKFTTTASTTYQGRVEAVGYPGSMHLVRRMWFSKCPGGERVVSDYIVAGVTKNACDRSGTEFALTWSQKDKPSSVTQCKLKREKTYYLNYLQTKGGSEGPTPSSRMVRGFSARN